jgi:hypothetical protein
MLTLTFKIKSKQIFLLFNIIKLYKSINLTFIKILIAS